MLNRFIDLVLQIVLVLLVAPLVNGIIRKIKSTIQHRKGAPVLQLYFDLIKLFKKNMVISQHSSWIFIAAPYIYFITVITAFIFVPVVPQLFSFGFIGDAILVVYLLALGRFFLTLSGLDTGSTFGGMGSSREMMISSLIEPSLIITIFTLGLSSKAGSTAFQAIYEGNAKLGIGVISPIYLLLLAAMFIIIIAETARIPVDDPSTHLELTMVHEAMILEYSGRYLALMEYGASLKQLILITITANVFLPFGNSVIPELGLVFPILIYLAKVIVITVIIAIIEINTVKLRLFSVPNLAALAFILALLGFMSGFVFGR
ncbi:MAG: formate hydrogenlyase subunit 4 [Ruminiclostridium sp.]|nr:formate hydrogenlyase subunit 4 [Ruminiclostridium sp.]